MKATARRREGYVHEVETDDGHTIVADEPAAEGGTDAGPAPTRLLASSLAACTAITIEMYADRKGWDVGDLEVEASGEEGKPASFDVVIRLPESIDAEQEKRILNVAGKCPVHRMLAGDMVLSDRVERI
ncbi:MAG: OsmC family protein [Solirubrobacteraceae bacterium]